MSLVKTSKYYTCKHTISQNNNNNKTNPLIIDIIFFFETLVCAYIFENNKQVKNLHNLQNFHKVSVTFLFSVLIFQKFSVKRAKKINNLCNKE